MRVYVKLDSSGYDAAGSISFAYESHSYGSWETANSATCENEGLEQSTCSKCDTKQYRILPQKEHNLTHHALVTASSTKIDENYYYFTSGIKEYYQCSSCKKKFLDSSGDSVVTDKELNIPRIYKVELSCELYKYDGQRKEPEVIITDYDGGKLSNGTDFTVTYSNNINNGTAKANIDFKGNYSGSFCKEFKIYGETLKSENITLDQYAYYYSDVYRYEYDENDELVFSGVKSEVTPKVDVCNASGDELKQGVDYTVEYINNKKVGTASVVVIGIGDYSGTASVDFSIVQKPISKCTIYNATYNGKARIPAVYINRKYTEKYYNDNTKKWVEDSWNDLVKLKNGTDYTIKVSG